MENKKVSILMPVYNAEKFINKSLESLINQTYLNIEILICDDYSGDNTSKIINSYLTDNPKIKFFQNSENLGYLKTCNFLAKQATGEYITFQDADDISMLDRVEKLVREIEFRNLDILGSYCSILSDNEKVLSTQIFSEDHHQIMIDFQKKPFPPFCGSAVLIKKSIIDKHGLYDPSFDRIGSEDFDWLYRLALENYRMGNISEPLYLYRQHSEGISKTHFKNNILALYSGRIAKDLFLERLQNHERDIKDFNYFADKYQNEYNENPESLFYRELNNSFLSKNRLYKIKCIYDFNKNTNKSFNKYKYLIISFSHLIFGFNNTERIKSLFRN